MQLFRRRRSEPAPAAAPDRAAASSPRLLVCDDNESVTQLLEMMFSGDGWDIEVVRDGQACLDVLARSTPDVVLLDQQMDGLTGLETAARARRAGFDRPILLFSAYLDDAARARAQQLDLLPVSKVDFPAVVRHVRVAHRAYRARQRIRVPL